MVSSTRTPVLIVDFGSQFTQLLARRFRELGVFCEVVLPSGLMGSLTEKRAGALVLSGGPQGVMDIDAPSVDSQVFSLGIPVLGVCYGFQLMARLLSGEVRRHESLKEYGLTPLSQSASQDPLFQALPQEFPVFMSHGDYVSKLPPGFVPLASSNSIPYAAAADPSRKLYGLQFHPEVAHTPQGMDILKTFALEICQLQPNWTSSSIIDESITRIRELVGKESVILGLSGGVDSVVAAVLIHRAIGPQLHCVFIETGLLRKGEAEFVQKSFGALGLSLIVEDASSRFLEVLQGVSDPEIKRKRIGKAFIDAFKGVASRLKDVAFLAQGTIYPDVIESAGSAHAHLIKSHHNVGGLPEELGFKLLEPLRMLFKDEVRRLGKALGLSDELLLRHPFPGPGLAVRLPGVITPERIRTLQEADAIFLDELQRNGYMSQVSQAFGVLLPVSSVGVAGDGRIYAPVLSLRAVVSPDFMTAEAALLPLPFLKGVARRITNEVQGISRVLYDLTDKPPASIEWE